MNKCKYFVKMLIPVVLLTCFLTACSKKEEQPPEGQQEEGVKPSEQAPAEQKEEKPAEQPGQPAQPPAGGESSLPHAKQDYEAKLDSRLSYLDNKMNELKDKAARVTADTKTEMDKAVTELTTQREDLKKKVDELKAASVDSWETLKAGVDSAVDTFEKSYDHADSQFK